MKGQLMQEEPTRSPDRSDMDTTAIHEKNAAVTATPALVSAPSSTGLLVPSDSRPAGKMAAYLMLLVASAVSGLALSACFFPMSLAWLAWFALVPVLTLVRTRAHWLWVYLCVYIAGLCFFWPALSWMPYANDFMRLASYALSIYCALYFLPFLFLVRVLDNRTRLPLIVSVPVVWVGLEFLRSFLLTGFPWYFLAHTQHYVLHIIQVADLGGAYTVSFLIAIVNALVFEWLYLNGRFRSMFRLKEPARWVRYTMPYWLRWQTAAVAALLVGSVWYGSYRLAQNQFEPGPRLALLQGNIDQNVRNEAAGDPKQMLDAVKKAKKQITEEYDPLWQYAAKKTFGRRVDLIVWPETSFPMYWRETKKGIPPFEEPAGWPDDLKAVRDLMREFASKACETNLLVGLNTLMLVDPKGKKFQEMFLEYNSALLVRNTGATGGRYDKIHRIPFGEYMPLRDEWPWLRQFTPYGGDGYHISKGKDLKRFKLDNYAFGVLICYEDTDPFLARQYGAESPDLFYQMIGQRLDDFLHGLFFDTEPERIKPPAGPVDFFVNISNDGWYAGTSEHNEHLAIARFRAVETRKAVARAVNMGISAVIDPNGQVLQPYLLSKDGHAEFWDIDEVSSANLPLSEWNRYKQKTGVLTAVMPIDRRITLYSQLGDWFPNTCWAMVTAGLIIAVLPWKKLRPVLQQT